MKTSKLYLAIISLIALLASNAIAAAWTGSTSEPKDMKTIDGKSFYVITTAEELAWFAKQVNNGKSTINAVLGNPIIFGKDHHTKCAVNWTPIGKDVKYQFAGILDGGGFTIYGIYVNNLPLAGIVGVLNKNGVVRNLRTISGSISGTFRAGGFAAHNDGLIQNVENNNKVVASYKSGNSDSIYIGGIAGHNNGTVSTSLNKGSVGNEASFALSGGIAGKNSGKIENSTNSGSVTAVTEGVAKGLANKVFSGGIAAYNTNLIDKCSNDGTISADGRFRSSSLYFDAYSGGIVGFNSKTISNCINRGTIVNKNEGKTNGSGKRAIAYSNGIVASGKAKNSIDLKTLKYWLNGTEIQGTAGNMQKDQFAWILNTTNGTESNSGVWTRTTGCPDFANKSNLAIHRVVFNDDGTTSNRYTNYKGLVTFPEDPEPAEGYIFSGWYNANDIKVKSTTVFTADQTVKSVYTDASDVFWTITFYNAAPADTILETKSYRHGSEVAYGGVEPTLTATAQYAYAFKGWNVEPANAVEDFDYHAVYDSTIRSYTIVFNNSDGSKMESATFKYGKMPSCDKTPTRAATAEWKYAHKGWKPALDYVTGEASYTAIYDSVKVEYKVTFMNGVDVIDEQMVPYGDAAVAPANVTRDGYKFIGWNASFARVTENLTVKALFEELIMHIVSVVNSDGAKIVERKIEDGEKYTLPDAPEKDGYTFDAYYEGDKKVGVAGDEIVVSSNVTIVAKYIKNPESSSSAGKSSSSSVESSSGAKPVSSSGSVVESSSSSVKSSNSSAKSSSSVKASSSSSAKVSSSSKANSSSSSIESSSSKKTEAVLATKIPKFSVRVFGRNVQIANAKIGSVYALLDMQGRVLLKGRVGSTDFNISAPRAGAYFVRINDQIKKVNVR